MELRVRQHLYLLLMAGVVDAMRLEPQTAEIAEGQPHTFTCQGQPNKVINFENDNQSLVVCIVCPSGAEDVAADERYSCEVSTRDNSVYTMTIASVKRDDDRNGWHCQIGTTKSNFATLRVKYRPEIEFFVNGNPREYVALEGDQVDFECSAEGYPTPSVTLFKNDNSLKKSTEGTLKHVISSAACRDTGAYSCEAENSEGTRRSELKLQVKCKPVMVEMQPTSFEASIQGKVTLQVQAIAYPPPHFTWYSPSGFKQASENGTLISDLTSVSRVVIDDITEDDFGEYHVIVANELGKANITVSLRLKAGKTTTSSTSGHAVSSSTENITSSNNHVNDGSNKLTVAIAVSCVILALLIIVLVVVMVKKLKRKPKGIERNVLNDEVDEAVEDPATLYAQVRKPQDRPNELRNVEDAKEGRDEDGLLYVRVNLENGTGSCTTHRPEEGPTLYAVIDHDTTSKK